MAETVELKVKGMTCSGCAATVTKYLENQGLKEVYVNFTTDEVRFADPVGISKEKIAKGINALGYQAILPESAETPASLLSSVANRFWITLPFTLLLNLHMFVHWHWLHQVSTQFWLSLPVAAIGFYFFGRSAWHSIRQGMPNMDVLIFTGAFAAFIYSLAGCFLYGGQPQYIYFETTATIITLVLLGNMIEKRAASQTASVLTDLEKLKPSKATKILHDLLSGSEQYIETDAALLQAGDLLLVKTGEVIPADGLVVSGNATVNESMISGESLPAAKLAGSRVITGTIVTDGNIKIKATATGKRTRLSGIIDLVKNAQAEKPNIQRFGDRVSAVFVPVVVGISVVTFLVNYMWVDLPVTDSLMRAVAVLVISCPCAMGLATPLAVMVGIGSAARKGILIKSGAQMETLALANYYIFDKTGTLTTGNLKIEDFKVYDFSERDAKNFIHYIERHSNHPVAKSILEQCADWHHHNVGFANIEEVKGLGMKATDQFGNIYTVGSLKLSATEIKTKVQADIYFTFNGKLAASFNVNDEVLATAGPVVEYILHTGSKVMMLSGDSQRKCDMVAAILGIGEVKSGQTPEQKLRVIRKLSKENKTAMVGDGINDAPALALAHIGISHGEATDIARNTSGVVLTGNAMNKLIDAIALSKAGYQTIRQNLFWALLYNVVAIPLAAAGFLSPMVAALGMAFSDLVVVGNSLRLRMRVK